MNYELNGDGGNSSYKVLVAADGNDYSTYKQVTLVKSLQSLPNFEDAEIATLVQQLHNNLIVNITSPSLQYGGLFAVGKKAQSLGSARTLNINESQKSTHDFTVIMPLAILAAQAVKDYFAENKELPATIELESNYVTALPVLEFNKVNRAKTYSNRLKGTHVVHVHVTSKDIVAVTIKVEGVKVVQEGVPAIYALLESNAGMFEAYNELYKTKMTGKKFVERKLLLIDIGDGTTEYIYVQNKRPSIDVSVGFSLGVGHAANKAKDAFQDEMQLNGALTRQEFMEIVTGSHKFKEEAQDALLRASHEQVEDIIEKASDIIQMSVNGDVDDIVIFGGGSITFKDIMQDKLKALADRYRINVLWVNEEDAPHLNVIGLSLLNRKAFFLKRKNPIKSEE